MNKQIDNKQPQSEPKSYTVLCPVIFEGRKYFGIREFDCHSIGLYTEKTLRGTLFTVIPISPKKYREKSPTKAKVEIELKKDWTIFKIFSDWGECSTIEIHNSLSEEIKTAKKAMIERGLNRA